MIAGAEVPHPGLERRDPAGADARDGVDQVFNLSTKINKTKMPILIVKMLTFYNLSTNGDVIDSLKQQAANPAQLILHSFPGQVSTWFSIKGPWEKQAGQVRTWFHL